MIDVALHIAGAALMMVPAFFASTPLGATWFLAVVISLFWFVREALQDHQKHGFRSPGLWSGWKIAEALAPCVTALGIAVGVTIWRVV